MVAAAEADARYPLAFIAEYLAEHKRSSADDNLEPKVGASRALNSIERFKAEGLHEAIENAVRETIVSDAVDPLAFFVERLGVLHERNSASGSWLVDKQCASQCRRAAF